MEENKQMDEALKGLTISGINRFQYIPYKMPIALAMVERIAKRFEPEFIFAPETELAYTKIIQWFHGDPEFNDKGYLRKGIMLCGPTGTGKTVAMKIMAIYRHIDNIRFINNGRVYNLIYEVVDVKRIEERFIQNAFDGIQQYTSVAVLCLDDLGNETGYAKSFGNKIDVISYIISERNQKGLLTLATTNFPLTVLEEKYDDRIISRIYGMFNFITMKGPDFRKKNKTQSL